MNAYDAIYEAMNDIEVAGFNVATYIATEPGGEKLSMESGGDHLSTLNASEVMVEFFVRGNNLPLPTVTSGHGLEAVTCKLASQIPPSR